MDIRDEIINDLLEISKVNFELNEVIQTNTYEDIEKIVINERKK